MKQILPTKLEEGRIRDGYFASRTSDGPYGAFFVQGPCGCQLKIVSSAGDETGWEHVSVSTPRRPPNWQEMCFVKSLFWDAEECVVQFHPPESEYVNNHPHCLHLWRSTQQAFPLPPSILVGVKAIGTLAPNTLQREGVLEMRNRALAALKDIQCPTKAPGNDQLSKLWNAIVENTKGDGFWIGEILLTTLEREVGFNPAALRPTPHPDGFDFPIVSDHESR